MSRNVAMVDGQWYRVGKKRWLHGCCDCRLMHWVDFKVVKGELYTRWKKSAGQTVYWRGRWGR